MSRTRLKAFNKSGDIAKYSDRCRADVLRELRKAIAKVDSLPQVRSVMICIETDDEIHITKSAILSRTQVLGRLVSLQHNLLMED